MSGTPAGPADPVDVDVFRQAMGRFATGVTVVSAPGTATQPHAMTANAVTSVSLDPCLLLVCVEQEARFHEAVVDGGAFGVSVLGADQRRVAQWLATRGRPLVGQLAQVPHHAGPATGVPLVTGALSTLECSVQSLHDAGDHTIVVGRVLAVAVAERGDEPLVWYRGGYRRLA